jgi:hypothetical protein
MGVLIRFALAGAVLMAGAAASAGTPPAAQLAEPQAKANFLYHLSLFATWPEGAARPAPLSVCVLGASPVTDALRVYDSQVVGGRQFVLRALRAGDDMRGCHILFVAQTDSTRLASLLRTLARQPVLTVGENDDFLEAGGMFRLMVSRERLRFDVDLEPAEHAGITFHSQLLAQATSVRRGGHVVKP